MFEMTVVSKPPPPEIYDKGTAKTSLIDQVFGDPNFTPPAGSETVESYPGEGILLGVTPSIVKPLTIVDFTGVTKEEINNALANSRTRPETTEAGINNMANNICKKDGNFYLVVLGTILQEYQLTYKEKNGMVKFYAYETLKGAHGPEIAQLVKLLFTDPINFNKEFIKINFENINQDYQKFMVDSIRQEEWEEIKYGPQNEPIRQQQIILDQLIDVSEEELKEYWFTDHAVAEWRGMKKASDSISSVKAFKDIT